VSRLFAAYLRLFTRFLRELNCFSNPGKDDARKAASRLFAAGFTARFSCNQLTHLEINAD
jgi:hypothetical protein